MVFEKNQGNATPPVRHKMPGNGGTTTMESPTASRHPQRRQRNSQKKKSQFVVELAGDEYDTSIAPSLGQKVKVESQLRMIEERYDRKHQLGLGAFAKVFYAEHRATKSAICD